MLALVLTVPVNEAELASDTLWALGVIAVEERASDGPFVELWTSVGEDPDTVTRAAEAFPVRWRWRTAEVDDAVADTWRQHAVPSWITPRLVVVPDWLDVHIPDGVTQVRIDPGASFGLGDHPTTVLTLRALEQVLWRDATVLDVGCGSGVLGITAAVLGASYVAAIDISAAAAEATRRNAERNGVSGRLEVSNRPLEEISGTFDIVLANILAPQLIALAPNLRRATATSGVLVVSGVLAGAHAHLDDALAPMQIVDQLTREGWQAVVLRH